MKKIYILLMLNTIFGFAQSEASIDTVRVQGYLYIRTNTKGELSDIPYFYAFIPLESMNADFKKSYENYNISLNEGIYNIKPFIADEDEIFELNYVFKKFYSNQNIFFSSPKILKNDFYKRIKNLYKFKGDNTPNRAYKIVYIDGLWLKTKLSHKAKKLVATWGGNVNSENQIYYFLIDNCAIGYEIDLNYTNLEKIPRLDATKVHESHH